jgi:hypothetical protein
MPIDCTSCRASLWTCPQCGSATCPDHLATYSNDCLDCALAYHASADKLHINLWFALGAALPWLVYASVYTQLPGWSARSGGFRALTTGIPALDVLIMFAVTSVFAGKALMGVRRWLHRRSFERHGVIAATVEMEARD